MVHVNELSAVVETLKAKAARARRLYREARDTIHMARDEVRASAERIRAEATHAIGGERSVIDIGDRPSRLERAGRTVAALVVAALALSALATFSLFFVELLLALVVATQVLGLRIDPRILSPR